jgi:hypothetical protein
MIPARFEYEAARDLGHALGAILKEKGVAE